MPVYSKMPQTGLYLQPDTDYLFTSLVLSKVTHGLPVYAAATPELTIVQNFLTRCFKHRYISYEINILNSLEKADWSLFKKVSGAIGHLLFNLMPTIKESSRNLRFHSSQLPCTHTEQHKLAFANILRFKYNLAICKQY